MESVWYYVVNGTQVGPVSLAELKEAAAARKLAPADLVWQEGTPDWVAAHTVAGLFSSPPPAQRPLPPTAPQPTYSLSPSPPPPAAPLPLEPEPLPLDDEPPRPRKRPRRDDEPPPAGAGMPEWGTLIVAFLRRVFIPDPSQVKPEPSEEAALARSGVMDATSRKLAVWRRAVLFVSALPCAFAALFGLITVIAMDKEDKEIFSAFGMFLLYIQALALFSLPVAAVLGGLAYDRLAASARWVLIGGLVSFAVPLAVAFVPTDWLIEVKTTSTTTVKEVEATKSVFGMGMGIKFYLLLAPAVLSLLPAVSRACVRTKLFLPESLVPGWGLVTSAPLCVLLTLATFVLLYHIAGNLLLIAGLLLWVGAPLLYLSKFGLLTRPITSPADQAAVVRTSFAVFALIVFGMVLLVIYLFTAKFFGMTLVGFDEKTSVMRPWNLDLHRKWIEYVGRSLFLSVFFSDLVLRMALSIWREERAFAGTPQSSSFDRTMSGLSSAILPRGSAPTPAE
ncbi:MAG: DUF4339 domain-containing protein [Planctomycetes bacterium]|nr:DUF4339 domain-containing protein [Planctomycetota bacterium]